MKPLSQLSLTASVCGALRAPWRERLRCTQTAALAYALLHLPPAAQGDATPVRGAFL